MVSSCCRWRRWWAKWARSRIRSSGMDRLQYGHVRSLSKRFLHLICYPVSVGSGSGDEVGGGGGDGSDGVGLGLGSGFLVGSGLASVVGCGDTERLGLTSPSFASPSLPPVPSVIFVAG